MNRNRASNLLIILFNEEGVYLLDFIKKLLLYFINSEDISYSRTEDYDKDEEIFYYYYIMKI